MKPILVNRTKIDSQEWDRFIEHSKQRIIYGLSWYLDVVCDDWNALMWPSAQCPEIVMPLPLKKKWSVQVVQQPLFCQYLGIFSQDELTSQQTAAFLEALSAFSYISTYSFHPLNFQALQSVQMQFSQIIFQENYTYWLSLNKSYTDIYNGFSKDRKLNVKRSQKFDWILEKSTNPDTMIGLFRTHHQSKIAGGVKPGAYLLLKKLIIEMVNRKCAEIWYLTLHEEQCAGALFVKEGNQALYLFNAADENGRNCNARTFLISEFIKDNAGENMYFDFETPQIPSIATFYKSFNGEKMPFFTIEKNNLITPFKQLAAWRKMLILKTS